LEFLTVFGMVKSRHEFSPEQEKGLAIRFSEVDRLRQNLEDHRLRLRESQEAEQKVLVGWNARFGSIEQKLGQLTDELARVSSPATGLAGGAVTEILSRLDALDGRFEALTSRLETMESRQVADRSDSAAAAESLNERLEILTEEQAPFHELSSRIAALQSCVQSAVDLMAAMRGMVESFVQDSRTAVRDRLASLESEVRVLRGLAAGPGHSTVAVSANVDPDAPADEPPGLSPAVEELSGGLEKLRQRECELTSGIEDLKKMIQASEELLNRTVGRMKGGAG
jgi:DNA repair exonuclease SbcCD ATPase subunit